MAKVTKKLRCPVDGCSRGRFTGHVMCAHHWAMVPQALNRRVWQLFRSVRGSDEHRRAVMDAIHAVIELEEKLRL